MPKIRAVDMLFLDDLFEMSGGYVLNFSDRTFSQFFKEEIQVDIDSSIYSQNGSSKGKRLRCFLNLSDADICIRALNSLWEYREAIRERDGKADNVVNAGARLRSLVDRIQGADNPKSKNSTLAANPVAAQLLAELLSLTNLEAQTRGFAFERFLKRLFDAYGLEARDAFRNRGEQIDGSFQLAGQTYLLEAKWQNSLSGVGELHAFHGKVEQKAAWTRGLFISNSGFSSDGIAAFGRGKRVICMDGFDLSEALSRNLSVATVLERKARRAAETGHAFIRVRDLF